MPPVLEVNAHLIRMNLLETTLLLVLCCVITSGQDEWVDIPPEPMNRILFPDENSRDVADVLQEECENTPENAWERTNLFESDIMLPESAWSRNALRDEAKYWRRGVVPYYIDKKYFNNGQKSVIERAIQEIRNRTCLRFRPYKKNDLNYITFTGKKGGCSSYVGRQWKGQEINLEPPRCITHGTVLHELLHSLGLHHQHSAPNRDNYIKILWENIKRGKEQNFRKMDGTRVTNLNVPYDYRSIMHYSPRACSRNRKPTIVPLGRFIQSHFVTETTVQYALYNAATITICLVSAFLDNCSVFESRAQMGLLASSRDEWNNSLTSLTLTLPGFLCDENVPSEVLSFVTGQIDIPPEAAFKMPYPIEPRDNDDNTDCFWERTDIIEGDIVGPILPSEDSKRSRKLSHWPNATIPYYIEEKYYSNDQLNIIRKAIAYINEQSCLTFRQYKKTDKDFVRIIGKENGGCLSALGRKSGGQEVSLEPPKCIYQHWVIHELMHAVGFYHQHSAYYRDEYVKILWENVEEGQEDNFQKYPKSWNTDYGLGYDYFSIMHYRANVFSKNGMPTIQPLNESIVLKQSDMMTQRDLQKIKRMNGCDEK